MRLKLEIVTGAPATAPKMLIPPKESTGLSTYPGVTTTVAAIGAIAATIILTHPGASAWWDEQPIIQRWQKFVAQNEWVVVPTHSSQPQEKPIFVLKYPRYLTSVPGDCRPIVKCRQLGLSKYQPGRGVRPHTGADFGAPSGTPVLAPINLKIVSVNPDSTAGGIISAESLDGRQYFRFVHLDRNSIRELNSRTSKIFNQGETIALVGFEPGGSWGTGPHLHFERYIKSPTSGKWELDWHVEDWLP